MNQMIENGNFDRNASNFGLTDGIIGLIKIAFLCEFIECLPNT